MTRRQHDFAIFLGLGVFWALAVAFVGVGGDFALNDDWAYAHSVRIFLETGVIERVAWTWASIVSHVWVGALASELFGFSYETLRWTGILFGFAACIATYGLGRALGLTPARSAAVAFVLALCPVHFNLSFTFMTDPPFVFWTTTALAALAAVSNARGPVHRLAWLVLASVAIGAAVLLRQPGVAVAAAGFGALVLARVRSLGQLGLFVAVGLAAGAAALAGAGLFFDSADGGGPMIEYFFSRVLANPNLLYFVVVNALSICVYLGWFYAPLVPFVAPPRYARQLAVATGATALLVPVLIARLRDTGPPGTNLIWDFGLGAPTLAGLEHLPQAPAAFWWIAIPFGAGCGAWFLGSVALAFATRFDEFRGRTEVLALPLFAALYLGVLGLRVPFFDRYLTAVLPALGVLGLVVAGRSPAAITQVQRGAAVVGFAVLALFAVLGTRDYMERHRSRSVLLAQLESDGISPRRIDGGFEFSGLHNFDKDEGHFLENARRWVYDDEFLLTYAPTREGYAVLRSLEYRRLLPPGREQIYLLHRIPADTGPPRHSPPRTDRR